MKLCNRLESMPKVVYELYILVLLYILLLSKTVVLLVLTMLRKTLVAHFIRNSYPLRGAPPAPRRTAPRYSFNNEL